MYSAEFMNQIESGAIDLVSGRLRQEGGGAPDDVTYWSCPGSQDLVRAIGADHRRWRFSGSGVCRYR